ncbi:MAG: hypothetical protein DRR16_06065 [Candidatus Parabeggiatoa sp. nov. 3]|nr:MAG: hypothetical protein DRQ99_06380 [Gammaproteobacteria bacterium]RKZ87947.1 MAG: hypothetical protein DRR16_06065 [Gammaproteobacteria bacterium]
MQSLVDAELLVQPPVLEVLVLSVQEWLSALATVCPNINTNGHKNRIAVFLSIVFSFLVDN